MDFRTIELWGWGRYPRSTARVYRPERLRVLRALVREEDSRAVIARGLGRSYGDACLNSDGRVVLTERLNCFLEWDPTSGEVTCEAGVTLPEILRKFLPLGWFLPVTPGTKFATIGGCIAADVHGKNHHVDGSFANHLEWVDVLLADGSEVRCSKSASPELFHATVGGMGLTGVILRACLRLKRVETAYVKVTYQRTNGLDETLEFLETEDANHTYSVGWIDCLATGRRTGRSVVMWGDHCPLADLPSAIADPLEVRERVLCSVPFDLPGFLLNRGSIRVMNGLYYRFHHSGRSTVTLHYDPYFYPLDSVLHWNRGYGRRGFLQYQCVVPPGKAKRALQELLACIQASGNGSFLAVLKRFGGESGMLSFPMPGLTFALDFPMRGQKTLALHDALDRIVLSHGGRVYLAKDARLAPESFLKMYSRFEEWKAVKSQVDPGGLFTSDLSRRLRIT